MPDLSALLGGGLGGQGGAGGMGGMAEMTSRMLENPQMRENMIQMMSQPGMMDMIAASNPQLRQMLDAMPGIRQTMQNPELLRMMLNPDFMRAAAGGMQMPGAMVRITRPITAAKKLCCQSACHAGSLCVTSTAHLSRLSPATRWVTPSGDGPMARQARLM